MHESFDLIDRARRRLDERGLPCAIAGGASEPAILAAEETLACTFPPSYRAFLARFGAVTLPQRVSTILQFVGLDGSNDKSVVARTEHARLENRLGKSLVIVALGSEPGEWYCLDADHAAPEAQGGECPIYLFDARDNQLDQRFYDDFGAMVGEVMTFVLETCDEPLDLGGPDVSGETSAVL